jgi:hypothetical protein
MAGSCQHDGDALHPGGRNLDAVTPPLEETAVAIAVVGEVFDGNPSDFRFGGYRRRGCAVVALEAALPSHRQRTAKTSRSAPASPGKPALNFTVL